MLRVTLSDAAGRTLRTYPVHGRAVDIVIKDACAQRVALEAVLVVVRTDNGDDECEVLYEERNGVVVHDVRNAQADGAAFPLSTAQELTLPGDASELARDFPLGDGY